MSLLYIGAYTDAFPITVPMLRHSVNNFIFVEKQPYYGDGMCRTLTEGMMMKELLTCACGALDESTLKQCDDHWTCKIRDGGTLMYFFNTRDDELTNRPALVNLLPTVKTLYIQGFTPCADVLDHLPDLTHIYSAYLSRWVDPRPLFRSVNRKVVIKTIAESSWLGDQFNLLIIEEGSDEIVLSSDALVNVSIWEPDSLDEDVC